MNKESSDEIFQRADQLVKVSRSLDYKRIVAHDQEEVERLNQAVQRLRRSAGRPAEPLANYAEKAPAAWGENLDDSKRRQALVEALTRDGFGDRIDRVYNSFARERSVHIKQLAHRRGLPRFDLVLAPDFAPVPGSHGIFIAGNIVSSAVLASDQQPPGDWRIVKRKAFSNLEEMLEVVTLIAAGFD